MNTTKTVKITIRCFVFMFLCLPFTVTGQIQNIYFGGKGGSFGSTCGNGSAGGTTLYFFGGTGGSSSSTCKTYGEQQPELYFSGGIGSSASSTCKEHSVYNNFPISGGKADSYATTCPDGLPWQPALNLTTENATICKDSTAALKAVSPVSLAVFKWYASQTDLVPLYTGSTYITPPLSTNTDYYVSVSGTGVPETPPGDRVKASVTVIAVNNITVSNPDIFLFEGQTSIDIASKAGVTYDAGCTGLWYKNGILLPSPPVIDTAKADVNQVYQAGQIHSAGCRSELTKITVSVLKKPGIHLSDSCSFIPKMVLDIQYSGTYRWQYCLINSTSDTDWEDLSYTGVECTEVKQGWYRVKIIFKGAQTYTLPRKLIELKKLKMPGGRYWYQMSLQ